MQAALRIGAWRGRPPPWRTALVRAAGGLALIASGSCQSIHATVAWGIGIGVDVQVSGILHAGAIVGSFAEAGWSYGDKPTLGSYLSAGLLHHTSTRSSTSIDDPCASESCRACGRWRVTGTTLGPWFFAVRLGWDPLMLGSRALQENGKETER